MPDRARYSLILTAYRRIESLPYQIAAAKAQEEPPSEIILCDQGTGVEVPKDIVVIRHSMNTGVWGRLDSLGSLSCPVAAVIDDDTIPGCRWASTWLDMLSERPALLGGVGLRWPRRDGVRYPVIDASINQGLVERAGWYAPNEEAWEAQLVGHAWMFPRVAMIEAWPNIPECRQMGAGEDYHLCAIARTLGWPVFVPPHPNGDRRSWSSIDGRRLGSDGRGLAQEHGANEIKQRAHSHYWRMIS